MRFIYSKLQDSPEADEYEKQNFRTSNSWFVWFKHVSQKKNLIWSLSINNLKFYIYVYRYRLREKQRADFDLNFREDMQKATKNE